MEIAVPGNINCLHVAAEHGHLEILKDLILRFYASLNIDTDKGFFPIHFAVSNNHIDCVAFIVRRGDDNIKLKTTRQWSEVNGLHTVHESSTPLHIAAVKNHVDMAKYLFHFEDTEIKPFEKNNKIINDVDNMGWSPLHSAAYHGSRDVIILLLSKGADLSGYTAGPKKSRKTAIDLIINKLSTPVDFMEGVFNSYISTNDLNVTNLDCEITVDYSILVPSECEENQIKVIQAMIETGNEYQQKKLLVHPLVESFLYLKWKALLPFFYTILAVHMLFVTSLTIFCVSVYLYKDTDDMPSTLFSPHIWIYVVYVMIIVLLLQVSSLNHYMKS